MKKTAFLFLTLILAKTSSSQVVGTHLDTLQLSGIVANTDQSVPLSNVNVHLHGKALGPTDKNGYFEIYAGAGDTVFLSHLGFKNSFIVLPLHPDKKEYYVSIGMSKKSETLKEIVVFPLISKNIRDFIQSRTPKDPSVLKSEKNLDLINYEALENPRTKWSKEEIQRFYISQFEMKIENKDRKNSWEAGVATPATQVLNTNTAIGLILLARELKNKNLGPKKYANYKSSGRSRK